MTKPHRLSLVAPYEAAQVVDLPAGDVILVTSGLQIVGRRTAEPTVIEMALPEGQGRRVVELLLPHDAPVELISLEVDGDVVPAPPRDHAFRWIHYGSSISHGFEAFSPDRTWPQQVALAKGWSLRNLSFTGNAQLDGFVARVIRDAPADLITLKVGINLVNADSMRRRAMLPALHAFLDTIREGQPETPIVLISAISCPIHENSPGPVVTGTMGKARASRRNVENDDGALTLKLTREVVAKVHADRSPTDAHLHFVDGQLLFGADDTHLLYDGLHPTAEGLDLIAQRFPVVLEPLLQSSSAYRER